MMIRKVIYTERLVKIIGRLKIWLKRILKNKYGNSPSPGELPLLSGRSLIYP